MSNVVGMNDYDFQRTLEFLQYYLKESSKYNFNRYCKNALLSLLDVAEEPQEKILGEEMSIIILWGTVGTIILKTHFNLSTVHYFLTGKLSAVTDESVDKCRDFMKEFSNMQAGYIRGALEQNKIVVGMSLPFLALGSDEFAFRKMRDADANLTLWKLIDDSQNGVSCTAEIILNDHAAIKNIQSVLNDTIQKDNSSGNSEDEGDVVFL